MSKTRDFLPLENALAPWPIVRRSFVAVIGIDDYQYLPRLRCAVNDATRVQEALVTHFGFEAPIPPLLNERATQKAIIELVRDDLPALVQRDDALVLFFAGHGTTRKRENAPDTGYLAPVEVGFPPRFSNLVDMEHLLDDISRLEAHHILVILDACNSGMALEAMRRTRQILRYQSDLDRKRSRKVITSARGDQLAADQGPMPGNSLFTGTLLEGLLQGYADLDGNRIVTSAELGLYLQQRVAQQRDSAQTPEFGVFGSDESGELVFPLPSTIGTKRPAMTQETEPSECQVMGGRSTKLFELANRFDDPKAPFIVPFLQDKRFVGRGEDLEELHALLRRDGTIGVNAVTGMGGIGKTQLVVEYAYRHRRDYPGGVYWVNGVKDWQEEFARLAERVGLRDHSAYEHERQRRLPMAFVEYLGKHPGALVIFDNVEDPLELQNASREFVPARLPCRLLFTTRRQTLAFPMLELRTLDVEDALRLLLDTPARRHILDKGLAAELSTARSICQTLGFLALAIVLASAHLERAHRITLDGYLQGLLKHGALLVTDESRVDSRRLATQHTKAVRATLEEQWAALRVDGNAARVLQTAALLGEAEQIPRARLSLLTGLPDEPDEWRDAPLEEALRELSELSLVERLTESGLRLHPLVREFAEWKLGEERQTFAEACATRLADALYDMARLSQQVDRRGVDEVLADLRVGIGLSGGADQERLVALKRPLDREVGSLRGWDAAKAPALFLQQLRNCSFELGIDDVRKRAEGELNASSHSWLRERFVVGTQSDALVTTLVGHTEPVMAVAATGDGRFVLSASKDKTCKVWDLRTGIAIRTFTGHQSAATAIAVTLAGKTAVSGSADGIVKAWEVDTGRVVWSIAAYADEVRHLEIPPRADFAIGTSADGAIGCWKLDTGEVLDAAGHLRGIGNGKIVRAWNSYAFLDHAIIATQDGKYAIAEDHRYTVSILEMDTGAKIHDLGLRIDTVCAATLTPNGQKAILACIDETIRVWDTKTGKFIVAFTGHVGAVNGVIASGDGRLAVSASNDGTLKIWDLEIQSRETALNTWDVAIGAITCIACNPASEDAKIGYREKSIKYRISDNLGDCFVAVAPDGQSMISAYGWACSIATCLPNRPNASRRYLYALHDLRREPVDDRVLRVRNKTGAVVRDLRGHDARVTCVAYSPGGHIAISGAVDGTLRVWDINSGQTIRILAGHQACLNDVIITPDGKYAISAAADWTLKSWQIESGQQLGTMNGHSSSVNAVAITGDAKYIISASTDSTLKVWDIDAGQTVRTLQGHVGPVHDVAVTPDCQFVVSVSQDRTLRIWRIETGQQVVMLESHAPLISCAVEPSGPSILAGDEAGGLHVLNWVSRGAVVSIGAVASSPQRRRNVKVLSYGEVMDGGLSVFHSMATLDEEKHLCVTFVGVLRVDNAYRYLHAYLEELAKCLPMQKITVTTLDFVKFRFSSSNNFYVIMDIVDAIYNLTTGPVVARRNDDDDWQVVTMPILLNMSEPHVAERTTFEAVKP